MEMVTKVLFCGSSLALRSAAPLWAAGEAVSQFIIGLLFVKQTPLFRQPEELWRWAAAPYCSALWEVSGCCWFCSASCFGFSCPLGEKNLKLLGCLWLLRAVFFSSWASGQMPWLCDLWNKEKKELVCLNIESFQSEGQFHSPNDPRQCRAEERKCRKLSSALETFHPGAFTEILCLYKFWELGKM